MLRVANLSADARYFRWVFPKVPPEAFNFERWIEGRQWIHDTDICGDYRQFWVVIRGDKVTYHKVEHNWWVERDPEFRVENVFEFTEISRADVDEKYAKENLRFVL